MPVSWVSALRSCASIAKSTSVAKSPSPLNLAGGLYVANCGDHSNLRGAKAEIAGLQEVFAHVGVIADPPMLKGRRYGNIILIASDTELPAAHQEIASRLLGGAVPAHYKGPAWTNKFAAGGQARHDPPSEATAPSQ